MKIAINGFGRIGRLVTRQLLTRTDLPEHWELALVNDPGGDAEQAAYLAEFDSVHGRWEADFETRDGAFVVDGRFKKAELLKPWLDAGAGHVIVSAPVGDEEVPNVVVGVNDDAFDPARHRLVSGASCTTNCVAPVVKVLDDAFGIRRGSIDTIHAVTASQKVMDGFASDVRRGRSAMNSLIPTSTGAAKAVQRIFPELEGHLSGLAVRVPLTCPSITDCTFELRDGTDVAGVNAALEAAAKADLSGILGYETRPLVSIDYVGDRRSSIVDAPSTMVVDGTHVKVLAWYDNETGYSHRLVDLLRRVAA